MMSTDNREENTTDDRERGTSFCGPQRKQMGDVLLKELAEMINNNSYSGILGKGLKAISNTLIMFIGIMIVEVYSNKSTGRSLQSMYINFVFLIGT